MCGGSLVSEYTVLLWLSSTSSSCSLQSLSLPPLRSPWSFLNLERRGCGIDVPFTEEYPMVAYSLLTDHNLRLRRPKMRNDQVFSHNCQ